MSEQRRLTEHEGLRAMFFYLDEIWSKMPQTEIGAVLSEIQMLRNGEPADRAVIGDWHDAVLKALRETQ
ncbi:hypothetical protein [Terriglobus aquaticus]|uniref:Addiction module component n=1 Tax=Terriglobus aquaticus TaxID=940139 RepID=A0ABW9KNP7_9BACT|nr:hypothetical protein [Terriglobus aquaticus]